MADSKEGQQHWAPGGRGAGLSLGAPRRRGGGRGGIAGGTAGGSEQQSSTPSLSSLAQRADEAVRSTDNDAAGSRIAAIQHGYLEPDPYSLLLGPANQPIGSRPPIINVGTCLRCRAIDHLVASFLQQGSKEKQIISLGAGSDSRYWRLHEHQSTPANVHHYVELDFAELTTAKVAKVLRHPELLGAVASDEADVRISPDRASLQSSAYSLLACDLRTLASSDALTDALKKVLDPTLDTLILAECVLTYLSPKDSTSLLQHLGTLLDRPYAICYEMCISGDTPAEVAEPSKFGAVMLNNLQARNLSMPGARAFSTLSSQAMRFEKTLTKGGNGEERRGQAKTLKRVWQDLDDAQRQRLSRLQGLDEVEELEMLLSHYAISWYACDAQAGSAFLSTTL